jgi:hypothetical protein
MTSVPLQFAPSVIHGIEQPAYKRRIALVINILGPIMLLVALGFSFVALYLGSNATKSFGPQFVLKDGPSGAMAVNPPGTTVMATAATNASMQNWTLRVGQQSCQTSDSCLVPGLTLPDPATMIPGTLVTVRNASVDTEMMRRLSGGAYISPPQKVHVQIGNSGDDYVSRGDMKSYVVFGNTWYHAGIPTESFIPIT